MTPPTDPERFAAELGSCLEGFAQSARLCDSLAADAAADPNVARAIAELFGPAFRQLRTSLDRVVSAIENVQPPEA